MWELLQIEVLQSNFQNVGTITNRSFTVKLSKCGNYYKSKFYSQIFKLWELLQTKVLLLNFQNVGTITNRSFTVKLSKCENYYKPKFYS
ncbi:hypothetical protein LEP1GSC079_1877 [Leptospira interrogans str. FPW1039]|uniref:Uncharacterized protein n=2 Tax=Leptospira interrogans TaxID=173 RepID=A0A0F6IIS5_LEPIR|nr:hypothetical protein LEP1GSC067_3576 [Leptospira interrogans serovar Lora str. TE 1992]EMJ37950.1 hypothetical protein LEP1GSC079_1877 [Leptospira interrogans str. FPW1039]